MEILRYLGAAILIWMGWRMLSGAKEALETQPDPALIRRTARDSFVAGLLISAGNPKAILFFVGILPNLFDMSVLTAADIVVILMLSAAVPFTGNLGWALIAHRARVFLRTPRMVKRVNQGAGVTLIGAGGGVAIS